MQKTIEEKELLSVVHLLVLKNNPAGTKSAFAWCRKNYEEAKMVATIFESRN